MKLETENPLVEISKCVKNQVSHGERVAVIFDLDSTLFCVSRRTQAILRSLAREQSFASAHVELSEFLSQVEVLPTDWGIRGVLARYPEWANSSTEMLTKIRDYWRKHFFANHFLEHDTIYPSANEYVTHLHQLGADILYLTGRNEGLMKDGTLKMLKFWGFPNASDSTLFMKPNEVMTDEGFKATVLRELVGKFSQIWFFENEPVIIEQVRALVHQVRIVFVDSVHSGKANPPRDLPTIKMSYQKY